MEGHHSEMTLNMLCLTPLETKPACVFNNMEYSDGDMFRMDNCRFCQCQGGVSICFTAQCGELSCERYYMPEGECCPVCEGKESCQLGTSKNRLPSWLSGKDSAYQYRRPRRHGFSPWAGKIPWRRAWQPTPVFLPGEFCGQRSLVGYSPWCQSQT